MIVADPKQKKIIAILTRGDKEFKQELVVNETGDPEKCSTNDLTFHQANQIIIKLGGTPVRNKWTTFDKYNKQHSKIRSLCIELNWSYYNQSAGQMFADMSQLGHWLQTKAPEKMPLVDMNPKQLSRTIFALQNMQRKDIEKQTANEQ